VSITIAVPPTAVESRTIAVVAQPDVRTYVVSSVVKRKGGTTP